MHVLHITQNGIDGAYNAKLLSPVVVFHGQTQILS